MSRHQITPAWQTSRGPLVQAHGCAEGVPVAGMRVFGETRQNLWSNPSGTSAGITATENEDGSLSISGTASDNAQLYVVSYIIKPSTSYTVSVDEIVQTGNGFYISEWASDGSQITTHYFGTDGNEVETFTSASNVAYVRMGINFPSGANTSGTFRVMLNEGSSAEPWCPPGLTSVSEMETVTAGKNLIDASSMAINKAVNTENGDVYTTSASGNWYATETKIPCPPPGSSIVCSADSSHSSSIAFYFGDGTFISGKGISKTQAVTVPDGASLMAIDVYKDYFANFQLELGSSATAYEPPSVTTTPIDLSGHQLRSLPDGTRDVLAVDGSGAVSVEQACAEMTVDGQENWRDYQLDGTRPGLFGFSIKGTLKYPQVPLCDRYAAYSDNGGSLTEYPDKCAGIDQNENLWIRDSRFTSLNTFKAHLASNPVIFVAESSAPSTVPLDPITPPSIPVSDATLWAASDVPCELEATTWTASGAEQGRQQAALVRLAQQVRQQAETVSALAAQSLEA